MNPALGRGATIAATCWAGWYALLWGSLPWTLSDGLLEYLNARGGMTAVFFAGVFWMLLLRRLTYFLGEVHDAICDARESRAMAAAARTEASAPGHEPAAGLDGRRDLSRSPATGNPVEVHASSVRVSCCFDHNGRPFEIRVECADCRVVEMGFDSLPEAKDGARAHHCEERAVGTSDSEAVVTKSRRWDGNRETERDTQYYDQLDKVRGLVPDTDDETLLRELRTLRELT